MKTKASLVFRETNIVPREERRGIRVVFGFFSQIFFSDMEENTIFLRSEERRVGKECRL